MVQMVQEHSALVKMLNVGKIEKFVNNWLLFDLTLISFFFNFDSAFLSNKNIELSKFV
jgi:hypothetical protein